MSLLSKLQKAIKEREEFSWTPFPEILMLPQIPKPLHGMAPRVVLGKKWWDLTRHAAYRSTDYHCVACKTPKAEVRGNNKWLEGHEVYRTDYNVGRMYYERTEPLCPFCHNYIHQGRLQSLLDKGRITQYRFTKIIQHGERVLAKAGLVKPPPFEGPFVVPWSSWRLVVNGMMYKPKFKSEKEWEEYYAKAP